MKGMVIVMDPLSIAIIIFCIFEGLNIIILYFYPHANVGNGLGVFQDFDDAQESESSNLFISYLINWVAGVKLIFVLLLVAILIAGTEATKVWAIIAMIISVSTYFWKLHPIIAKLDAMGKITPAGYSKVLRSTIVIFLTIFILALIIHFFL